MSCQNWGVHTSATDLSPLLFWIKAGKDATELNRLRLFRAMLSQQLPIKKEAKHQPML